TIEVIVVRQIDPSEPALTEAADDPVAPDPGRIARRRSTRSLHRRLKTLSPGRFRRLIQETARTSKRRLGTLRFGLDVRLIHRPVSRHARSRSWQPSGAIVSSPAGLEKWGKVDP